jgi:hypothetical protein
VKFFVITFAFLLSAGGHASAQQPVWMTMDHTVPWIHEQSGLVVPPSIAAIPRKSAMAFASGGWDQSMQFETADNSTLISVYIYQAAVQDVGMLFAEAQKPLERRVDYFGGATPIAPPIAFLPPSDTVMSGLKVFYNTTGQYKSTALAIVAVIEGQNTGRAANTVDPIDRRDWMAKSDATRCCEFARSLLQIVTVYGRGQASPRQHCCDGLAWVNDGPFAACIDRRRY